jgi:hypothetical protein
MFFCLFFFSREIEPDANKGKMAAKLKQTETERRAGGGTGPAAGAQVSATTQRTCASTRHWHLHHAVAAARRQ